MTDLIFLDTETTGLDPDKHEIWEIAWAINNGNVESAVLKHSLNTADPKALELNGYFDRHNLWVDLPNGYSWDLHIRKLLEGNTIVCANPPFDRMFMRARWGLEPYHYRSLDIESMAFSVLGYLRPKGLAAIRLDLVSRGYDIPMPDHSAAQDVESLRAVFKVLQSYQTQLREAYYRQEH